MYQFWHCTPGTCVSEWENTLYQFCDGEIVWEDIYQWEKYITIYYTMLGHFHHNYNKFFFFQNGGE